MVSKNDQIVIMHYVCEFLYMDEYGESVYLSSITHYCREKTGKEINDSDLEFIFNLEEFYWLVEIKGKYLYYLSARGRDLMNEYGSYENYLKNLIEKGKKLIKEQEHRNEIEEKREKKFDYEYKNEKYNLAKNRLWLLGVIISTIIFILGYLIGKLG